MKYDVVIIGGGLGGLQCAYILAKHGKHVCVIEKNRQPGGCLQSFRRGGHTLDTGFHYVGGLDEGQPLNRLFHYFALMQLPWQRLDENGFDEIMLGGKSYFFANGYERFAETLAEQFPHQRKELHHYTDFLRRVKDSLFDSLHPEKRASSQALFCRSAGDFLNETISDPLLRNVLLGASLKMEARPAELPLYTFAQINSSYIQSAWRLRGGGSQIADSLVASIRSMGGTVMTGVPVTQLVEKDKRIAAAALNESERIEGDIFISDIHPVNTLELLKESEAVRSIFRKRITALANTFGMFTVQLIMEENTAPYLNRNIFIYRDEDVWRYSTYSPERVNACAMVSFQAPHVSRTYTGNIDILTPMFPCETEQWTDSACGRRGAEYEDFKQRKADELLRFVSEPLTAALGVKPSVRKIYTSSPLTWRDYTGAPGGSAYGVRKDCNNMLTTLLSPRTPLPNLFLTGQNINLHGVLGVSMTSFLTCAEAFKDLRFTRLAPS